jgi:methylated-DNA-[protein]-cysteine S-methyltransferase
MFSITNSQYGHFGLIFKEIDGVIKLQRLLLPADRDSVLLGVNFEYPDAKESQDGMSDLRDLVLRYLKGEKVSIAMKYVDESLCSRFQLRVLKAEREIPYGKTATYSWLARKTGTSSARAVGSALARNPFPIVVPCHRAIRADRTVGGFQGGGRMKRAFLQMEGVRFDENARVVEEDILR